MDKCPYCGAETRQGDNFCLNCGNRLLPNTPPSPQQGQPVAGEAIAAVSDDWGAANQGAVPVANNWSDGGNATVAESPGHDAPTMRDAAAAPVQTLDRIEQPARFILRSENGEVLQEYPLDKLEITIGRAPNSDILLSKDKLTSRRHATIRYENSKYWLHDEHSANGTFVNGQQIEDNAPYELKESDLVGIGEHELVFRAFGSQGGAGIEDLPTQAVPFNAPQPERTFRTLDDAMATQASSDDFGTHTIDTAEEQQEEQAEAPVTPPPTFTPVEEEPVVNEAPEASEEPVVNVAQPTSSAQVPPPTVDKTVLGTATPSSDTNVTFNRLTSVPQPTLPDISALMAALSTLDGQVMSLQEQINTTQESMRNHDAEIAQTAGQLRTGVRRVTERMDNTIADVARSREALAWAELLQLMEDVMNNPRDIEYVTKLARKARELNKVFQIHQNVLNTMAECNSLLRSLIGEDK